MTKFLQGQDGVLKTFISYDESIYYDSGLAGLTNITLPNSGSFSESGASDILIILNKRVCEVTRDFDVIGGSPYTQIRFVYALPEDSVLNFKQGI